MSRQDYATPPDFIEAVQRRFGNLDWDLAATEENTKAERYITPEDNSLICNWKDCEGLCWLNCPFGNSAKWAEKCCEESKRGVRILSLTLASVDSNWFAEYVHRHAFVLAVSPRITFVGEKDPFNRPLILSCYGFGVGFDVWRWK